MDSDNRQLLKRVFSGLQYFWSLAIPFWIFRDAGKGTVEQRIANYRYNREQRKVLPFYVWKWVGIAVCLMNMTQLLSELMLRTEAESTRHLYAVLFCASAGIGFAFSCVVITILFASYLFLTYVKR